MVILFFGTDSLRFRFSIQQTAGVSAAGPYFRNSGGRGSILFGIRVRTAWGHLGAGDHGIYICVVVPDHRQTADYHGENLINDCAAVKNIEEFVSI